MAEQCMVNDPEEMKISSEASWLCELFQTNSLSVEEKQKVIKSLIKDYKIRNM